MALHREIAKKLRSHPDLWNIPINNIIKWRKLRGGLAPALMEWEHILNTSNKEEILLILENDSEESIMFCGSWFIEIKVNFIFQEIAHNNRKYRPKIKKRVVVIF